MSKVYEGYLDAKGFKVAFIVSRFNSFITERLLEGAQDAFRRHGGDESDTIIVRTPGAFEMPLAAQKIAALQKVDAIVALGAVIRGSTPHFDYVSAEVSKGLASVSLKSGMPIAFGVLTCDTIEQAVERAGTKAGNKGFEAAVTAIEMLNLFKGLDA